MSSAAHKASKTVTRASIRRKRATQRRIAVCLLAAMMGSGAVAYCLLPHGETAYAGERFDTSTALTSSQLTSGSASRDSQRDSLDGSSWDSGENIDEDNLTLLHADNPVVRALINGRDLNATPAGFNPDHDSGDDGSGYPYGQCTWWAYRRRHELGLPAGSRMGDARNWADAARRLGYWTDSTPRQGDIVVFRPDQRGADPTYGHVAIVESVGADGSVVISESNVRGLGVVTTRTMDADTAHGLQFIHY